VYRAGFASETASYVLFCSSGEEDFMMEFKRGEEQSAGDKMKAWIAENPGVTVHDKHSNIDSEPVEFCLQIVKEQMESIIRECKQVLGTDVEYRIYLSGRGNFRETVATLKPYKGNRDASHKPVHYQAIRDYLVHYWNAQIIEGKEADDEVSIVARALGRDGRDYIVATIDKDLDQIPGMHYNYMKKVMYDVSEEEAVFFFYQQILSGDATDNIGGCYKLGPAKAEKLLRAMEALQHERDWESLAWDTILSAYADSQIKVGCPYADKDTVAVALENARLVKLQEWEGQLWNPPGEPDDII
jgi:hypothetical protein